MGLQRNEEAEGGRAFNIKIRELVAMEKRPVYSRGDHEPAVLERNEGRLKCFEAYSGTLLNGR